MLFSICDEYVKLESGTKRISVRLVKIISFIRHNIVNFGSFLSAARNHWTLDC